MQSVRFLVTFAGDLRQRVVSYLQNMYRSIQSDSVGYFAAYDDLASLNKAITYILQNEVAINVKIIVVKRDRTDPMISKIAACTRMMARCYRKLKFDFIVVEGDFSPELVASVSEVIGTPRNFLFMACSDERVSQDIASYGGVRMVTH